MEELNMQTRKLMAAIGVAVLLALSLGVVSADEPRTNQMVGDHEDSVWMSVGTTAITIAVDADWSIQLPTPTEADVRADKSVEKRVAAWKDKGHNEGVITFEPNPDGPGKIDNIVGPGPDSPPRLSGYCSSIQECTDYADDACDNAGHDGVDTASVTITVHVDGSRTCSGDCLSNGAVAFVTCS